MNVIIAIIAKFRIEVFDERQQVLLKKKRKKSDSETVLNQILNVIVAREPGVASYLK